MARLLLYPETSKIRACRLATEVPGELPWRAVTRSTSCTLIKCLASFKITPSIGLEETSLDPTIALEPASESDVNMNVRLQTFYEQHHANGHRLRQSFMERTRADLFAGWIGTGKRVLDLGCRDGTLTRHYVPGNEIIGADIDVAALRYASETYGIKVQPVDLNDHLPFDDDSLDVVVMAEVLEHLPYPTTTLPEIQRVLKPGGLFIGNVPLAYHLKDRYRVMRGKPLTLAADPTHVRFYSYDSIHTLLSTYFVLDETRILKGEKWAHLSAKLFARNLAFRCVKAP